MKKVIRFLSIAALLVMTTSLFNPTFADPPDPPPVPGGHGGSGDIHLAPAPIDNGLSLLLIMGLGYAAIALWRVKKKEVGEETVTD
jgi:hypothetical protein